jgi:hypothetical protein
MVCIELIGELMVLFDIKNYGIPQKYSIRFRDINEELALHVVILYGDRLQTHLQISCEMFSYLTHHINGTEFHAQRVFV